MTEADYPNLAHFLAGYLHQDWMLEATGLPAVARAFTASESPEAVALLRADIARFLAAHADPGLAYASLFPNGVLPSAWGMDGGAWLAWVARLLDDP